MIGSILAALKAGKIDTTTVTRIEQKEMIKIEYKFISEGIELKKYISSGNKEILKIVLSSWRKFSTYNENTTPKIIPKIVAVVPIKNPTRKKIFIITPAVRGNAGFNNTFKIFKKNTLDVSIAEQHAITFACGMALKKFKPIVGMESTFMIRSLGQIKHDICINNYL